MKTQHLAILSLLINSAVWGLSWIGFKSLNTQGIHPLWMTAIISSVGFLGLWIYRPAASIEVFRSPALRWVVIAAGLTNVCFNTAVALGDVLRVTLLFYLMPVWAALLAYIVLGEYINRWQSLRLIIGLSGAGLILWQPQMGFPLPTTLPDWLGITGGACFAANNIGLRKASAASDWARSQAMFMGGTLCSMILAIVLAVTHIIDWPNIILNPTIFSAILEMGMWSVLFLVANYSVQYGAARLPANLTALIMLTEIFIAGSSSAFFGVSVLRWQEWVGGILILLSPFLFNKQYDPKKTML
jgi:drug/metabolite transporter (DMT)-like permease